ncbi:helix-turn-helix domain-containing protein, partial [Parabacteroides sp. OttesenSCG-928-K15]|nr:helix-turn-helix domain-containing protein [Parabacteroides sp. OttesenSCG-928-K15]
MTIDDEFEKMETLLQLAKLTSGTDENIYYLDWLERLARQEDSRGSLHNALLLKIPYYYARPHLIDSFFYQVKVSKEYFLKEKSYKHYFEVENFVVNRHIEDGSYQLALDAIEQMMAFAREVKSVEGEVDAYESMGRAYLAANREKEALDALEKGINLLLVHFPERKLYAMEYYFLIINTTYSLEEYTVSLSYCDHLQQLMDDFEQNKKGTDYENLYMDDYKMHLDLLYVVNYAKTGDFAAAQKAMERAQTYAYEDMEDSYILSYYLNSAIYYHALGENKRALENINSALQFKDKSLYEYLEIQDLKAQILADIGDYETAYKLTWDTKLASDSLASEALTRQISELRTIHNVYQLEADAERSRLKAQTFTLTTAGLSVIALLLLFILIYIRRNSIRLKEKNKRLFEQLQEQNKREQERKNLIVQGEKQIVLNVTGTKKRYPQLFVQLEEYLTETESYLDTDLSREGLALKLGTNRQYLCDAIQDETGLTFNDYINNLRLIHAQKLLLNSPDMTIEEIFIDSGFATKSTFYRLFRKKYGLTPTEIRKFMEEKELPHRETA